VRLSANASDRITRIVGLVAVTLAAAFLLAPVALTAVLSFSNDPYFGVPPKSWGLRQYETLINDPIWRDALLLSIRVALPVGLLSALIAVPAVFAIHRSRLPGRHVLHLAGLAGIIIPISAFAVAMFGVLSELGLLGTYSGLVLANTVLAIPLMLIVTSATLSRMPAELELAAMVTGASRMRAWFGITVRLLLPAIAGGFVLAFVASFDEAVFINFIGGPGLTTLPKAILDSARLGVNPVIMAVATLLMVATSLLMILALRFARSTEE
jgi:ABC-type spermidine/putrescine transport system permease subunit II